MSLNLVFLIHRAYFIFSSLLFLSIYFPSGHFACILTS